LNKADFISLIEQPDILGAGHITALKTIAADFPYFQGVQLVLTKALYNEKHYEFEKQLKYASLMLPDRAVLFKYIHNLTEAAVQQPEPTLLVQETTASRDTAFIESTPPEAYDEEFENGIEDKIVEPAAKPESADIVENLNVETEWVDEQADQSETIEVEIEPEVIEAPKAAEINPNETHSFAEWLQLQAGGNRLPIAEEASELSLDHASDTEITEQVPTQEPIVMEPLEADLPGLQTAGKQPAEPTAPEEEPKTNIVEFESILDKFIRENPRISRGKAEFYSPVNMAKQSVEQDEELVSETLANIYYKQGHYKKAIRVYEKLCLLYPHKLSYFADLIQKIKTENKD
jgi:tetratricopeptide (TPR) repeat protein